MSKAHHGSNHGHDHSPEDDDCAICLAALSTRPRLRLPCGHRFHVACVSRWLARPSASSAPSCPVCRRPAPLPALWVPAPSARGNIELIRAAAVPLPADAGAATASGQRAPGVAASAWLSLAEHADWLVRTLLLIGVLLLILRALPGRA